MTQPDGIHHLAISTARIKEQIEFFTDVLGGQLVALYWMHGVKDAWHGFVRLHDRCYVAFVQMPAVAQVQTQVGVTHAGQPAGASAPGTMQHLALNVGDRAQLLRMRDRIRAHGVPVLGPIDHGMCTSIYFAGPEQLTLEIATSEAPIDSRAWIDPDVVRRAGISADELARYQRPPDYPLQPGPVAQPAIDRRKPHMAYPDAVYQGLLAMPDERFTERFSETEPPVKVAAD